MVSYTYGEFIMAVIALLYAGSLIPEIKEDIKESYRNWKEKKKQKNIPE